MKGHGAKFPRKMYSGNCACLSINCEEAARSVGMAPIRCLVDEHPEFNGRLSGGDTSRYSQSILVLRQATTARWQTS